MHQLAMIVAFGFSNLAMLGWLVAASTPLLIHLWNRRRVRESPWAAMQFLLAAVKRNARRMQLQQWLLLALRTLLIALVVLAVAEPYGVQLRAGGSSSRVHKVLVLDGSFSMAYRSSDSTSFERAKRFAADAVRASGPADACTVILMGEPSRIIASRAASDFTTVAGQIDAVSILHTGADVAGALTLVDEALSQTGASDRHDAQEIYFLTDLQRASWGGVADAVDTSADRVSKTVIDLGQPRPVNLAITSVSSPGALAVAGRETVFNVTLHQFAHEPRLNCRVELWVEDVPVGEQTIDVPAGGVATLQFTHRFSSPGNYVVSFRAAGENLDIDNIRWLVVPVRNEIRVLCVAGREGAARYVAHALNPDPTDKSPIRPVVISELELADTELSDFDCVYLCNVAHLLTNDMERLSRFAAAGGGVVFFLGDRVVADVYNAWAGGDQPLMPAVLGEVKSQSQFGVDPLEYRHPIVAPFRGREQAGLLTTPIRKFFHLDVLQRSSETQVALATLGGDALIVTRPLGRGRVVLVATDSSTASVDATGDEPWTLWPTWPSFLPIVHEMLSYATAGHQQIWQQSVGSLLEGRSRPDLHSSSTTETGAWRITRPDGRIDALALPSASADPNAGWHYGDTDVSGIYSLTGPDGVVAERYAVNVDIKESDLAKVDSQHLPPDWRVRESWQESVDGEAAPAPTDSGWSELLLWIALGALFLESVLAWLFGRGVA